MKILKIITSVLSVVTGIYILLSLLLRVFIMIYAKTNLASVIGIIGGADGPTAIFVANRLSLWAVSPIIIFVIAVITNIFLRIKMKKKR